jgi:hypothetical protein
MRDADAKVLLKGSSGKERQKERKKKKERKKERKIERKKERKKERKGYTESCLDVSY